MASEPATAPIDYHAREGFFDEVFAGPDGAPRRHAAALVAALERLGPEHLAGRRAPARRDLHAAGHHVRRDRRGRPVKDRPVPARPRPADPARPRSGRRSSAAWRSASAR